MITNYTEQTKLKARQTFKFYNGGNDPVEGQYVCYTDPSAILYWVGANILPVATMAGGAVMKVHKGSDYGMVVEYLESYKDIDTLFKMATANLKLNQISWDEEPIIYYEWGCMMPVFDVEMASVFVKELFKYNVEEEEKV